MKKRFTMITIFDKESLDKINMILYNTIQSVQDSISKRTIHSREQKRI